MVMEMFEAASFASTIKFMAEGDSRGFEFKPRKGFTNNVDLFLPRLSELSKDQGVVVSEILFGQYDVLTVTGKAGTGKTHVLKLVREMLEELYDVKVVVVAPTGVAGQIAGGATINSRGLGRGDLLPRGVREHGEGWNRPGIESCVGKGRQHLLGNDSLVVILDEAYATSSEYVILFWQLCNLIRPGEVKFICMGDPGQLPPVNKTREGSLQCVSPIWETAKFYTRQGGEHIYGSIMQGPFPIGESHPEWRSKNMALTTNHRQKEDRKFVSALNYVRLGGKLEGPASILLSRFMPGVQPHSPETAVHIFASRKKVAEINELAVKKAKKAKAKCKTYRAITTGDISKIDIFPAKLEMELAVGLPFMVRQNISDKGVYNGTIGIIQALHEKSIVIDVKGRNVELEFMDLLDVPEDGRGRPICTVKMLPGHLGVGITGHKCQGLTIEDECIVHLDPQNDNWLRREPGAMYVMLSRVTSIDKLFIDSSPGFVNSIINASGDALEFIKESEGKMSSNYGIALENGVTREHVENMMPVFVEKQEQPDGSFLYGFDVYHTEGSFQLVGFSNTSDTALVRYALIEEEDKPTFMTAAECPYHEDCCKTIGMNADVVSMDIGGITIPVATASYDYSYSDDYKVIEPEVGEEILIKIPNDSDNTSQVVSVAEVEIEPIQQIIQQEASQVLDKTKMEEQPPILNKPSAALIKKDGTNYLVINGLFVPLSSYVLRPDSDFLFSFGELTLEVHEVNESYILLKAQDESKFVVEVLDKDEFAVALASDPTKTIKFEQFIKSESFAGLVLLEDRAGLIKIATTEVEVVEPVLNKTGLINIGVIGTAGRKEDEQHLNKVVYDAMYASLLSQLKSVPKEKRRLVSGGSSYADHLAVRAYLDDECAALTLHLPRNVRQGAFLPHGDQSADTLNYYHHAFSRKCFVDASVSLAELGLAINKGAVITTVSESTQGFTPLFERNEKIAESSDVLIAFTIGAEVKGGSKKTWDAHQRLNKNGQRVHVNVLDLIKKETVDVGTGAAALNKVRPVPRPVIRR